jgi:Family of unknown function (DUF6283)
MSLAVNKSPCSSCPYRKDTPPAVWDAEEYEKLRTYDDDSLDTAFAIFMCHQGPMIGKELVCKGWLNVHPDCIAVRIALSRGKISVEDRDHQTDVPLYASGNEAANAGMKGIRRPGRAARSVIGKLSALRARKKTQ